jgi:hypothetical protein
MRGTRERSYTRPTTTGGGRLQSGIAATAVPAPTTAATR